MRTLLSDVVFIGMVMYMQESREQILFSGYSNYMSNVCNYHMFLLCMYVAMIYVIFKCLKCSHGDTDMSFIEYVSTKIIIANIIPTAYI